MNAFQGLIDQYVRGAYVSDPAILRAVFTEDAVMAGFFGPEYLSMPAAAYADSFEGKPSLRDRGIAYTAEILSSEDYGQIGTVTIREKNYAGQVDFITNFQTVKQADGSWRICAKLFQAI